LTFRWARRFREQHPEEAAQELRGWVDRYRVRDSGLERGDIVTAGVGEKRTSLEHRTAVPTHAPFLRRLESLQARVDWFAFQSEDTEDAFMHPEERLAGHEPLEGLDTERELTEGEGAFVAQPADSQPAQVMLGRVFRTINDPQVFAASAFDTWLGQSFRTAVDDIDRLDDHALAAPTGEFLPPGDRRSLTGVVGEVDGDR
jgi:hypothetical protein